MTKRISKVIFLLLLLSIFSCSDSNVKSAEIASDNETSQEKVEYAMVIHGGAGTILKENMTDEKEKMYNDALSTALDIGEDILKNGGTSEEAVIATIMSMENSPLFNAGKGAVFTHEGTNELDASIMSGSDLNAGAVGGVKNIKNPILAAQAVMNKSEHVFLSGKGAEEFAQTQNIETIGAEYFKTESRWNSLQKALEKEKNPDHKFGTVGAVALDKNGNICAGTSTGGMTNKKYNRIGDSPVIGAGTYANNATCGVSCTGHGEYFIRYAVAHDVSAMMEYKGASVSEAADHVINKKLVDASGSGGLIALDKYGNVAMPFNTAGMYRGYIKPGEKEIAIYK